jgi:hypothetical protein
MAARALPAAVAREDGTRAGRKGPLRDRRRGAGGARTRSLQAAASAGTSAAGPGGESQAGCEATRRRSAAGRLPALRTSSVSGTICAQRRGCLFS